MEHENGSEDHRQHEPEYGWSFHRVPLLFAAVATVVFYIAVYVLFGG